MRRARSPNKSKNLLCLQLSGQREIDDQGLSVIGLYNVIGVQVIVGNAKIILLCWLFSEESEGTVEILSAFGWISKRGSS